ncbi:MAG: hypothetical protein FI686_02810 [SAR202 cluster bacterium]|nr:hypothetical protein [SAR202 cluster bacterium]
MENFSHPFKKLIDIIQLENRQLLELLRLYNSIVPIKMLELMKEEKPELKMFQNVDELSMKAELYKITKEKNKKFIINLFDEKN